ncbi:Holliday junction branch migration protein RuvA [Chloroflexota bacterium]
MIASLDGKVLEVNEGSIVLGVGGVGLSVFLPAQTQQRLRPSEQVHLHTYLVVREDLLALYGFETKEERRIFELLLSVSGIGPRLALAALSTLSPDAIRRAVFHEQAEIFSRVPGVGKKTAQKILLHLQDRFPDVAGLDLAPGISDVDTEVISALTALGYSVVEAQAALQAIPPETPQDIEERLRVTLQYFGG